MASWWRGVLLALLAQLVAGTILAAVAAQEPGLAFYIVLFGFPFHSGIGVALGVLVFVAVQTECSTRKAFVSGGGAASVGWVLAGVGSLWLPPVGITSLVVVLLASDRFAPA
jgi:hypothetical protein